MTEPMPIERFRALAAAWGGTVARWPAEARAAALLTAAAPEARAILAEADALDAALDRWALAPPAAALAARILAQAPRPGGARPWRRWRRAWWPAVGVAAALGGAAAGSVAAAAVAAPPPGEQATAFGELGGQEG